MVLPKILVLTSERSQAKGMWGDTILWVTTVRLVPLGTLLHGEKSTTWVLEYSRLAMGFANVRASRYGIR